MFDLRQDFAEFFLPPDGSVKTFIANVHASSIEEALRFYREGLDGGYSNEGLILRAVNGHFRGFTSEEEEDEALDLLLSTRRAADLQNLVNTLTWDGLDDELDEADLTRIAKQLHELLDHRDYSVAFLMRWFYLVEADALRNRAAIGLNNYIVARSPAVRSEFADRCLSQRDRILDDIAHMALRGQATFIIELRLILNAAATPALPQAAALTAFSWETFYTELICRQLEAGEYRLLLNTLPELFMNQLPNNPPARSAALFDMLRRWDRHFAAMQVLINVIGTQRQQFDMRRFMDAKSVMMANFPGPAAPAGAIANAIAAVITALNGVGTGFQALVDSVQSIAGSIDSISAPGLLDTRSDDEAVDAVNRTSQTQTLALLPTSFKLQLIKRALSGWAGNEDEQAALTVLRETKAVSLAEFLQLAAGTTWETLDSSINGSEYDDLLHLFRL